MNLIIYQFLMNMIYSIASQTIHNTLKGEALFNVQKQNFFQVQVQLIHSNHSNMIFSLGIITRNCT